MLDEFNVAGKQLHLTGDALAAAGIAAAQIATSSFRITWMIDRARLDDAVKLLHGTFIERKSGFSRTVRG